MEHNKALDCVGQQHSTRPVTSPTIVVLAASAGGLPALTQVLCALPPDFPAAIVVVQHRGEKAPEMLPQLLSRRTALKVRHARDGDLLKSGTVYVCPPGLHMTAEYCLRLVEGPRLKYVRPSADLLLQSVARVYENRAIGVVLSGSDGEVGSAAISEAGGIVIAQDPATSIFSGMPAAAIQTGAVNLVLPIEQSGEVLRRMVDERHLEEGGMRPAAAASTAATTVLLADDHQMILDGLHTLLDRESDIDVIATPRTAAGP